MDARSRAVRWTVTLLFVSAGVFVLATNGLPGVAEPGTESRDANATIETRGGDLPVRPDRVFARVQRLLGTDENLSVTVVIRSSETFEYEAGTGPSFQRAMGLGAPTGSVVASAYANGTTVVVNERAVRDPNATELLLAHEFTHVLLDEHDVPSAVASRVADDARRPGDGRMVVWSLYEGAAVFTEQTYWRRYVNTGTRPALDTRRAYRTAQDRRKYLLAGHRFGYRHLSERIDSPAEIPSVLGSPPQTTEELLHHGSRSNRPFARLSVTAKTEHWTESRNRSRTGELFVRVALADELDRTTAASAAEGWGDDRRLVFANGSRRGFVWVTRWEDGANATEFRRTFRSFLDERGRRAGDRWSVNGTHYSVRPLGSDGTAVVIGPPSFVDSVSASRSGANVSITTG